MPFLDVYIGRFLPPARWWQKQQETEGPPKRDSPFFPPSRRSPFVELKRRIEVGVYPGEQVDWGAWVARVSKAQIQAFVAELYDGVALDGPNSMLPHLAAQLVELREYVEGLEDGEYALVASEL